ncbi:unnamed protein product, partial [Heterosigma akashiwo]
LSFFSSFHPCCQQHKTVEKEKEWKYRIHITRFAPSSSSPSSPGPCHPTLPDLTVAENFFVFAAAHHNNDTYFLLLGRLVSSCFFRVLPQLPLQLDVTAAVC